MIDRHQVLHLAALARLELSEDEIVEVVLASAPEPVGGVLRVPSPAAQ